MNDYFKQVDLILQRQINKMPLKKDTLDQSVSYLKTYTECVFEMQDELRAFFNEYTKIKTFSESEISDFNDYNRKSISAFVDMFMKN